MRAVFRRATLGRFASTAALMFATLTHAQDTTSFQSSGFEPMTFASFSCTGFVNTPSRRCEAIQLPGYLAQAKDAKELVVVSHGSGGLDRRHSDYARQLVANGFNALVLDHWGGRGLSAIHNDYNAARVKGGDAPNQAVDALLAITALKATDRWASTKFGYLGESIGGSAAVNATRPYLHRVATELGQRPSKRFDAVVALYPGCLDRNTQEVFLPIPFLFVVAEKDDNTPAATCKQQSEWMNGRGGLTEWKELAGEHHDFDAPYRWARSARTENPSKCGNLRDKDVFTLDATGKQYPGTSEGLAAMRKDCHAMTWGGVNGGNKGDPRTGFDVWTGFFVRHLR